MNKRRTDLPGTQKLLGCPEKLGVQHPGSQIREGMARGEDAWCSQNAFRDPDLLMKAGRGAGAGLAGHCGNKEHFVMVF